MILPYPSLLFSLQFLPIAGYALGPRADNNPTSELREIADSLCNNDCAHIQDYFSWDQHARWGGFCNDFDDFMRQWVAAVPAEPLAQVDDALVQNLNPPVQDMNRACQDPRQRQSTTLSPEQAAHVEEWEHACANPPRSLGPTTPKEYSFSITDFDSFMIPIDRSKKWEEDTKKVTAIFNNRGPGSEKPKQGFLSVLWTREGPFIHTIPGIFAKSLIHPQSKADAALADALTVVAGFKNMPTGRWNFLDKYTSMIRKESRNPNLQNVGFINQVYDNVDQREIKVECTRQDAKTDCHIFLSGVFWWGYTYKDSGQHVSAPSRYARQGEIGELPKTGDWQILPYAEGFRHPD